MVDSRIGHQPVSEVSAGLSGLRMKNGRKSRKFGENGWFLKFGGPYLKKRSFFFSEILTADSSPVCRPATKKLYLVSDN